MFVITGGGSGIGKMLAQNLAARGEQVLIVGRREQLLQHTATSSPLISWVSADVATKAGREEVVSKVYKQELKGLINNAGVIDPIIPLNAIDEDAWQKIMAVNVNAPLFLTQLLLPNLTYGRVLNISSGAAYFPVAGWGAYCVSKAALSMLTRSWQLESKKTVFASVMPGIIDTAMQDLIRHSQSMEHDKLDFFIKLKQDHKLLDVKTVALFLSWLLLDTSNVEFMKHEWDIYDTSHHDSWLKAPYTVPHWE